MSFRQELEASKRASTGQLLMKCARLFNERAIASFKHFPARLSHTTLLPHINVEQGSRVTELAVAVGVSKQAVGQLVDELEAFGVVQRVADPKDGRAKLVRYTERGLQALLEGLQHLRSVEEDVASSIGLERMDQLREGLLALHDHLDPPS